MPQFEEGILDSEQLVTSYDTAESVDVISSQRPAATGKATTATTAAAPSLLRHATPKKPVAVAGNHNSITSFVKHFLQLVAFCPVSMIPTCTCTLTAVCLTVKITMHVIDRFIE